MVTPVQGGVSVLVVDDHPVFADALCARLSAEPGLGPVDVAYGTSEALARFLQSPVDVAVVDYVLGDGTGAELAAQIRDTSPATAVVMLSAAHSVDAVIESLTGGARAWLSKTVDTALLVRVMHRVRAGQMWLDPTMLALVLPRLLEMAFTPRFDALAALTAREREILTCLGDAMDRREVAARLGISENTVRTHIQNLLAKLEVHSTVEAVSLMLRNQPRDPDPEAVDANGVVPAP